MRYAIKVEFWLYSKALIAKKKDEKTVKLISMIQTSENPGTQSNFILFSIHP